MATVPVVAAAGKAARKLRLPPMLSPGDLLRLYRLKALKHMSQNFLLDPRICRKLVRSAGNLYGSHVIEIGSGPGSLTRAILEEGATCTAIEKDKRFVPCLDQLSEAADNRLKIIYEDVMAYPLHTEVPPHLAQPWESEVLPKVHLIGNLPFSISTILLIRWLKWISERSGPWTFGRIGMTLTFQKEVSVRLNAARVHPERCRLTIMSQGYCEVAECFTIVGGSFVPPPMVDVGVVKLVPRVKPLFRQKFELVEKVLRVMFNTKLKSVETNLKKLLPKPLWGDVCPDILRRVDVDPKIETILLKVSDFARICDAYALYCDEITGLYKYDYRAPKKQRGWDPEKQAADADADAKAEADRHKGKDTEQAQ